MSARQKHIALAIWFISLATCAVAVAAERVRDTYDLAIVDPRYPIPKLVGAIGWDPGLTYGRAVRYDARGKYFWGACPDDAGGVCPPLFGATSTIHGYTNELPNSVNYQRYTLFT